MSGEPSPAEASASAAGYYFQIRYALLRALEIVRRSPTASISIEKLDDVAVEYDGGGVDLEQLKHSLVPDKTYGDSDPALWRTLGNWCRSYAQADFSDGSIRLFLATTGTAQDGSALSKLTADRTKEDVRSARTLLAQTAAGSTNVQTAKDRACFLELSEGIQTALLRAVTLVEGIANVAAITSDLEEALHFACETSTIEDFRRDLEGWWFDRVMSEWKKGEGATIKLLEVDARVDLLRERYKRSSLTIDVGDEEPKEPLDGRLFVEQVRALKVGAQRIKNAQRDFLKAGSQRSKWLRQLRVQPGELAEYDAVLAERWTTRSTIMQDELSGVPTDHEKCASGRKLLAWAETEEVPIRNAKAQFLTSGSYHALADDLIVGWHPDFKTKFTK